MARFRLFNWIASGVTGMLSGACLISHAYVVQGGEPRSFALIGAIIGGMIGVAYAEGHIRLSLVGAACGSIAALTFFQVTVCDGSHVILPMAGAVAGLALFGVADRGLSSRARRRDSKSAARLERHSRLPIRIAAAEALGEIGAPARPAVPHLQDLHDDEYLTLRYSAAEALQKIRKALSP